MDGGVFPDAEHRFHHPAGIIHKIQIQNASILLNGEERSGVHDVGRVVQKRRGNAAQRKIGFYRIGQTADLPCERVTAGHIVMVSVALRAQCLEIAQQRRLRHIELVSEICQPVRQPVCRQTFDDSEQFV